MPDAITQGPTRPPNKNEVLNQINTILASYNGRESNIPQGSEYWALLNLYRSMP